VAVVDPAGRLVARAGDPELVTYWRSAAKPFQALPLLDDGAAERYGLSDEDLALACASHSSEPFHLAGVDRFLAKTGGAESELACGPHPPLSGDVAREVIRTGVELTPRWSNCSGKHTAMVALARHRGWPVQGYHRAEHPLQQRLIAEVERWTGLDRSAMTLGVDGCRVVSFGLPLRAMALAYARFGASAEAGPRRLWGAITGRPDLVAGTGRFETVLMQRWPGAVFAKVGAEGGYSAVVPERGWGIALKVEDGAWRAAPLALLGVLDQLLARHGGAPPGFATWEELASFRSSPVLDTHDEPVGAVRLAGELEILGP
jgi:L-asparaginase II